MKRVCPSDSRKETTFKVGKVENNEELDQDDVDDVEAKFVRRLKKGTKKYKGKLPFKCFNCGKIGHYASRFPIKV
jgi:hypothetical protein